VAVPVQPTPVDLWSTDSTLAMIAREGGSGLLVINRVTQRAKLAAEMIAVIRGLGCVAANAQLGNRVGFAASMGQGSTVLELEPSGKAAQEVEALAEEILKQRWST
jgi:chromosome partitioning protein